MQELHQQEGAMRGRHSLGVPPMPQEEGKVHLPGCGGFHCGERIVLGGGTQKIDKRKVWPDDQEARG